VAQVLIIGAGVGGLSTAMLLARDGHDVTVLERDPAAPPAAGHAPLAWDGWERRGVNQFRLPHFMLPRWWALVRAELPELVPALDAAGALRFNTVAALPESSRGPLRPDDDRFDTVTARRPVLEAAMAAAAAAMGVRVRRGVVVRGLIVDGRAPVPRITGVRTATGDVAADLVVDCAGRRSALPDWLAAVGARPPEQEVAEAGFAYYGRHFRAGSPAGLPDSRAPLLQHHDSVSFLTLPGDNDTWSVVLTTSARDTALRGLRDPARWHAVVARYPLAAHWVEAEPISPIDVMAGLEDRHRRYVVDGEPVATGVVAAADSWACTNPSLGRGVSIGLVHGLLLRDALRETGAEDHDKLVRRFDELTDQVAEPLYRATRWFDDHRLAEIDGDVAGVEYRPDDLRWAVSKALVPAALADPDACRAFATIGGLLALPDEVFAEPGVAQRVMALGAGATRYPLPGPDRAELLATVNRKTD
jgi:2-polyprenyl-6-methoxyphenol hydroxylase-like FAD-dependent oxidoreductase